MQIDNKWNSAVTWYIINMLDTLEDAVYTYVPSNNSPYISPLWECERPMAHTLYVITWERLHYNYVIMSTLVSQITSPTIVCSTVYSRRRPKKTPKHCVTGLCAGNSPVTGKLPAQRASNAENVSIWWRHHGIMGPFESIDKWLVPIEYKSHNWIEHRLCSCHCI